MSLSVKGSLVAGGLAGIGASLCCVGPLVLVLAGVGGTWISGLAALEPYRPIFVVLALVFLGLAFHRLYFSQQACAPGIECVDGRTLSRQRAVFWLVSVSVIGLLSFPWMAPFFY
ncbi:MAG: mercuric transporter MerT family protein [Burkholderiales bacterium]